MPALYLPLARSIIPKSGSHSQSAFVPSNTVMTQFRRRDNQNLWFDGRVPVKGHMICIRVLFTAIKLYFLPALWATDRG
ncbi:hypothetical protein BC937DRAFT_89598 [Endogone sp. FLAS-F59071]|nr:hypothetical protein BC937DRAFT_89598 [Endogone sp. FLAS-F59071]|eukprot:RUS17698.1 hypothetical protein BC937DRAFT_89598 [Endogone sp. FLAS-F59071]